MRIFNAVLWFLRTSARGAIHSALYDEEHAVYITTCGLSFDATEARANNWVAKQPGQIEGKQTFCATCRDRHAKLAALVGNEVHEV